jgi:hypothetical protein
VASLVLSLMAAALDGGCASRRRPRDLGWADASWGGARDCLAWVIVLCRQCGEAVSLVDAVSDEAV